MALFCKWLLFGTSKRSAVVRVTARTQLLKAWTVSIWLSVTICAFDRDSGTDQNLARWLPAVTTALVFSSFFGPALSWFARNRVGAALATPHCRALSSCRVRSPGCPALSRFPLAMRSRASLNRLARFLVRIPATALKPHGSTLTKIYPQYDRDGSRVTGSLGVDQPTSLEIDESSSCARCLPDCRGFAPHAVCRCQSICPVTMFVCFSVPALSPLERAEREAKKAMGIWEAKEKLWPLRRDLLPNSPPR